MPTLPLVTITDPDDPDAVRVHVDASIGGEPVSLLVDTGAGIATVPTNGHTSRLDKVGTSTARGVSGETAHDDLVIVPHIFLGPMELSDVRAARAPVDHDGLLGVGMEVLRNHRCHFRFAAELLEIDEADPGGPEPHPFTTQLAGQPMLPIDLGPVEVAAMWDTGASLSAVDAALADAHPELFEIGDETEVIDSEGRSVGCQLARLAGCVIGGVDFAPSACIILDLGPVNALLDAPLHLGLGMPLLAQADWYFDFPNGTWSVTPSAR